MAIRVLRLMEYEYETVEDMEKDMARWTLQSPVPPQRGTGRPWRMRFRSAALPIVVFDSVDPLQTFGTVLDRED